LKKKSSAAASIRLGIAGVGNMGGYHARMVLAGLVPGCVLAAVCDTDAERLSSYADADQFADSRKMIRSGKIDAILISTPHYSHTPIGVDALRAGLHVLVEKPISVQKSDAEKLLAARRSKKQVFAAMFNQRTDPVFQKIRSLVQGGELGEIRRIQWTITDWFRSQAYYDSGGWRATWAGEGGGVLLNQCVHNIDLFQWIFGMPMRVKALCCFGRHHDIEVEDDVSAIFEFANGATAVLVTSTGEAPGVNRLEVSGDLGRLTCEQRRLAFIRNEIGTADYLRSTREGYLPPATWQVEIPVAGDAGKQHLKILENFIRAILHGEELIAPAEDGLKSLELINGIQLASFKDRTVEFPVSSAQYAAFLRSRIAGSTHAKKPVAYQGAPGNYLA
jgi:predicted dehydrogenase